MNVYVVLLRRMEERTTRIEQLPLEPGVVGNIAKSRGFQVLDIITCAGVFDAVLVCRAPDGPAIAHLLNALEGWHTDAMLATSHVRYQSAPSGRRKP